MVHIIEEIESIEIIKGFHGKFIHGAGMTIAFWEIESGAELPFHSHVHEQMTKVEEGQFELTVNGETKVYTKGMVAMIPPNVAHSGKALTNCKLLDVFQPVREDYKIME